MLIILLILLNYSLEFDRIKRKTAIKVHNLIMMCIKLNAVTVINSVKAKQKIDLCIRVPCYVLIMLADVFMYGMFCDPLPRYFVYK